MRIPREWLLGALLLVLLIWKKDAVLSTLAAGVDKAKALIAGEEGLRLTAYKDSGGAWTIGYGHAIKPGEPYHPYGPVKTITREIADKIFDADLRDARVAVATYVKVPLTENQRAALTSLAFNIGSGAFQQSTLVRKLNSGDTRGAASEFDNWVYDNGVRVAGLIARRQREKAIFSA